MCTRRWWNFQCQLYCFDDKEAVSELKSQPHWLPNHAALPLWLLIGIAFYVLVGSGGQDHCGWAETGSDQHEQQGWTPPVYFPGMVCWWTGTMLLRSLAKVSGVCSTPRWLYPFTFNSDVFCWQSCKYEGTYECCFMNIIKELLSDQSVDVLLLNFIFLQTLFAGYTDNLIRVWQVTIGTR